MKDIEQRRHAIHAQTSQLREYQAMPQTKLLLALLDTLGEDLLEDLASVKADRLQYKQGALAQLRALRRAIASDDPHVSARA